jgi:hypothetical protein
MVADTSDSGLSVTRWNGPRRYGGPWYGNDVQRAIFDRGAKRHFPSLKAVTRTSGPKAGRTYTVTIDVPHYERRRVEILFPKDTPTLAKINAIAPTDSPHRYQENQLCIWHPEDSVENRWVHNDGLLVLLGLIAAHLFREEWWRETGEWLGPEAGHTGQLSHDGAIAG